MSFNGEVQNLQYKHIQKILKEKTVFKRIDADYALIIDCADIHYGSKECNKKQLLELIEFVKNEPNCYIIIGGDCTEHATTSSKSSVYDEEIHGIDQITELARVLSVISERILFIRSGNHGSGRAKRINNIPPEAVLAGLLNVPYVEGLGIASLAIRKNFYTVACWHNSKAPTKYDWLNVDIMFHEHKHTLALTPRLRAVPNKFDPPAWTVRPTWHINAGSLLNWGGYALEKGYEPLPTGFPIVHLSGEVNKWNVVVLPSTESYKQIKKAPPN